MIINCHRPFFTHYQGETTVYTRNTMTSLSLLLIIKIGVTGLLVAAPFLILPKPKLEKALDLTAPTPVLFRLYGIAITALLVGYAFGIPAAEAGQFPWGVTCMGIVSNGGAAFQLLKYSQDNKHNRVAGAFFCLVSLALLATMIVPANAMQKAW